MNQEISNNEKTALLGTEQRTLENHRTCDVPGIFVNDVNYSAGFSSLCLYADDTTQYVSHECPS